MHKQKNITPPIIALFWRDHRKLAGLFLAAVLTALTLLIPTVAYMDEPTALQGQVRDAGSGVAVADALIEIPALGLSARSNIRGEFAWSGLSISGDFQAVTFQIQASGYGNWTLENARILRAETLILEAELKDAPQTITVPPPSNERPMGFAAAAEMTPMLFAMGGAEDIPIPETIRVRVTGDPICNLSLPYTVEVIDFKDYVKHVLPNEWISSWPWESLRSGAMATKMYAWYWVALGGKWSDADVYDSTCDQVYNPAFSYASTNQAVDDTWNWRLTRDDLLIQTQYRAFTSQCGSADCMGQWDSRDLALGSWTWDEILFHFYEGTALTQVWNPPGGYSLRFNGVYNDTENRVLIPVDDPATTDPGPPVDVGGDDFSLEFWIKASPGENNAPSASCGPNTAWQQGNLLFDRDRNGADRDFGLSLANGQMVFGVSGDGTGDLSICGTTDIADDNWHHVAVQRRFSDGYLWLYVDGVLEAEADGPDGDISYPDDAVPPDTCGPLGTGSCTPYDPMLAIGAEKHSMDVTSPSFNGWLDEIRFSNVLRYSADFSPPADPFNTDPDTVALYTLNEGYGNLIHDTSSATGGPSDGSRIYGGAINGPEWSLDTIWYVPPPTPLQQTFSDVPADHWAYSFIEAVADAGLIAGYPDGTYRPNQFVTRAEVAVMLLQGIYGAGGGYTPPPAVGGIFTDIYGHWAEDWIEALAGEGITSGYGDGTFRPDNGVTRAEISIFLLRAKYGTGYAPPPPDGGIFSDVAGHWAEAWIEVLAEEGITAGHPDGTYRPKLAVTRAEMAVFLQRTFSIPLP